jgi:hypothetical protein
MQIGSRGIETRFDDEWLIGCNRALEFCEKVFFEDDFPLRLA